MYACTWATDVPQSLMLAASSVLGPPACTPVTIHVCILKLPLPGEPAPLPDLLQRFK